MKDSFVIRTEWLDTIKYMSHEDAGVLLKMIFNYEAGNAIDYEIDDFDVHGEAFIAFTFIKRALEKTDKKYEETVEKQREAGKRGAEKRWGANKETKESDSTDIGSDRVAIGSDREVIGSDSINEYDNDYLKETTPKGVVKKRFTPPTQEEVEAYCKERNSSVDPQAFYEYFTQGNWTDSKGQKVRNWKQKLITWENHRNDRASPKQNSFSKGIMQQDYDMSAIEEAILQ